MTPDNEILAYFLEESAELLNDLSGLGNTLKDVRIPNESESAILAEFAQKLNRLIGGTATVGFDEFAPLSRKTAMLAERCANIKEITIRILILNLNNVVRLLSDGFRNIESIEMNLSDIAKIEKKIDICMSAVGLAAPDLKNQEEIDTLFEDLKRLELSS